MRFLAALPGAIALALLGMSVAAGVFAQSGWPSKPIKFIVPFPPRGSADVMPRIVAAELSKALTQQFIIENRTGGGETETIGVAAALKSPPDGYTVFLGASGAMAISPTLVPNLPFDPTRDMAPVSKLAIAPPVLVVPVSSSIRSVKDLIATARAQPDSLSYGSAGDGTTQHLAGELLMQMAGIDMTHVPYKGSAPAATDTLAGQVPMAIVDLTSVLPHVRSGKLVASAPPADGAPRTHRILQPWPKADCPSSTLPLRSSSVTPAGVPRDIITRLNAETVRVLAIPEARERILASGLEAASS